MADAGSPPPLDYSTSRPVGKKVGYNVVVGILMLVVAGLMAFGAYTHRPTDDILELLKMNVTWVLKPNVYYAVMAIAGLLVIAGIWRIIRVLR
jgi:hypothetical protein